MIPDPAPEAYESRRLATEDGLDARWDSFVSTHDRATPYHTLAWRRALEQVFGYEPDFRLVVDERDEVVAAVPGFRTSDLVGHTVVNPFCEYGYPLLAEGADPEPVLEALRPESSRVTRIVKESPLSAVSGYRPAGYGGIQTGVTHRVDVSVAFEQLSENLLADSLSRRARLAREADLSVDDDGDLEQYHRLYRETMARLGSPQFPPSFFPTLKREFGDAFRYWAATVDGDTVGGVVGLAHGDTLCLLSNAAVRDADHVSPNPLLYLSILSAACSGDRTVVDFGRTEPGSGVDEFKSLFDGRVLPLVSFVTPPRAVESASVSGYKRLAPVARLASPVITHPAVGPRLKRVIHE